MMHNPKKFFMVFLATMFIVLSVSIPMTASPDLNNEIGWYSYEEGNDEAQQTDRPILIYFRTEWCGACEDMEEDTFRDPQVKELEDDVVFIKVDVDERNDLGEEYGIASVPTLLAKESDGTEIDSHIGFIEAEDLVKNIEEELLEEDESEDNEEEGGDEDGGKDESSQDTSNDENESLFWRDPLFLNIMVSILIAIGLIIFLREREDNKTDE